MNIELIRPTGVRLLTGGKFCQENIDIVPKLQSKEVKANGTVAPDDGYAGLSKVTVNVADSPLPIEVATEAEMTALLESGEVGGVYKYTGETTDTYENGALYVLENNLITFTVDGAEYQAEEGMTWEEWVESDYNVDGFTGNGYIPYYVMGQPYYYIKFTDENGAGAFIPKTETIEEKAYEWGYLGK